MKEMTEIEEALTNLPSVDEPSKYPAMTYEQGIEEALLWVLEELPDEEFEYSNNDEKKKIQKERSLK